MARIERIREVLHGTLDPAYVQQRAEAGWKPVAIEWGREADGEEPEMYELADFVPYGLRVSADCAHLEENDEELKVLMHLMELIVQDLPLSKVADELNRRGFRTRQGWKWGPVQVFHMLPRLIEVGRRIFTSQDWVERRKHIFMADR